MRRKRRKMRTKKRRSRGEAREGRGGGRRGGGGRTEGRGGGRGEGGMRHPPVGKRRTSSSSWQRGLMTMMKLQKRWRVMRHWMTVSAGPWDTASSTLSCSLLPYTK